jgi:proteasome accessory factor A
MGIETEYGISAPNNPGINPTILCAAVVNAYSDFIFPNRQKPMRWDYYVESPFNDVRGYEIERELADPESWTDIDIGMPNLMLPNGARFYVDHAHPEYSGPEVTNPADAALWDLAGDRILDQAAQLASELTGTLITIYKNNTDGKGASYGTHENYQVARETPFDDFVKHLTPFFVTRNIWAGSGRVGLGQESRTSGFQISQRADFFEARVGLETTVNRPIINTRDEPHADPDKFRRLHVIVGDANMSPSITFLKMGATALVLSMIEDSAIDFEFNLADPVLEMQAVSRDSVFEHRIQLANGTEISALAIQEMYLIAAQKYMANKPPDAMTEQVLDLWQKVLAALRNDLESLVGTVDWVTKKSVLDSYRLRDDLGWQDSKLKAIDLQYSDIRTEKGLAYLMQRNSKTPDFFAEPEIAHAVDNPPTDTRAYVRGKAVRNYGNSVVGASWESLIFQISPDEPLKRVGLPDARGYGAIETQELFAVPREPAQFISDFERHLKEQH